MTNRQPRIKLIFPPQFQSSENYFTPGVINLPYGMAVVASYLKSQDMFVEQDDLSVKFNDGYWSQLLGFNRHSLLNMNNAYDDLMVFFNTGKLSLSLEGMLSEIVNSISIRDFDLIGLSVLSYPHFVFALLLSYKMKKMTHTPIVLGGPFITLFSKLYLDAFEFIDYMIEGEGGPPLSQLTRYLIQKVQPAQIPGLIYWRNGSLIAMPKVEYSIEDMSIPDFESLPLDLYKAKSFDKTLRLPYLISRGCNGACSFCNLKNIEASIQFKSYKKVIDELRYLVSRYGSNMFYFSSDAINISYGYLEGLCDRFIDSGISINWYSHAKIKGLDKALLMKMKQSGCQQLRFGVESGSDRMLRLMNKDLNVAQIEAVLKESSGVGIKNFILLITGYPNECDSDIAATIGFIKRNKKYILFAKTAKAVLIYGCNLWENPDRHGITNLASLKNFRHCFSFDEINGLSWREKCLQQRISSQKVWHAVKRYLILNFIKDYLSQKTIYTFVAANLHLLKGQPVRRSKELVQETW